MTQKIKRNGGPITSSPKKKPKGPNVLEDIADMVKESNKPLYEIFGNAILAGDN